MFGSEILEVAIGLFLVYIVLSLISSAAREGIEAWLKTRSAHLEAGIRQLLHDPDGKGLAKQLYQHPLVSGLFAGSYSPDQLRAAGKQTAGLMKREARYCLPSYIPASNFALALLDIAARGPVKATAEEEGSASPVLTLGAVRASVGTIHNPAVQRALLTAVDTADGDLRKAQKNIEAWFDSSMDRVSGRYKRFSQKIVLVVGIVIAVAVNANTFEIATFLYQDETAREALVAQAQVMASDSTVLASAEDRVQRVRELRAQLDSLRLPLGWSDGIRPRVETPPSGRWATVWHYLLNPVLGWLATALAVSLGAPFWFDLLNKVMVIRSTVKPHEKSPEEASEDRQRPDRRTAADETERITTAAASAAAAAVVAVEAKQRRQPGSSP
jgi:hypothetical protein